MSQIPQTHYDIVILGGGGAGLFCAFQSALYRGRSVLIIDHMGKVGGKILISGGGRCNFTNLGASHLNYVSQNPHFMKSALSRFTPQDFLQLIHQHQIDYHEKKLGQLFCDHSARDIVQMLEKECNDSGVQFKLNTKIETVKKNENHFIINTSSGIFTAESLVVATGGLSLPKVGATGIGYTIAQQFGHTIVTTEPALDGFVFGASEKFILDPGAFFAISSDAHNPLQQSLLASRYFEFAHIDLDPVKLRNALILGKLDQFQVFKPFSMDFYVDLGFAADMDSMNRPELIRFLFKNKKIVDVHSLHDVLYARFESRRSQLLAQLGNAQTAGTARTKLEGQLKQQDWLNMFQL
jgi:hypothetical protein